MNDQIGKALLLSSKNERPSHAFCAKQREEIRGFLGLSPREFDIALCMMDGLNRRGIAEALDISEHTIDSHIRHIYTKLGVRNGAAVVGQLLVAYAHVR